mgnify:CR=1 FL=1
MFWNVTQALMSGLWTTFEIFILTLIFSLPLGLIFAFGLLSRFKPVKAVMNVFVWVIRGTPLMLQLIIIFYGPGLWLHQAIWSGDETGRITATVVAFVINYACYFSVIFRGGIEGVPAGQREAGQVLGMTVGQYEAARILGYSKAQTFFRIILPQVFKRILPSITNEVITLVKDTSLARIIAAYELTFAGAAFMKSDGLTWPLFYTGVFYLVFVGILTLLFNYIEKKLDYFR